jgi:hypothetical protein
MTLTDEQWAILEPLIPERPRDALALDLAEIFAIVLV